MTCFDDANGRNDFGMEKTEALWDTTVCKLNWSERVLVIGSIDYWKSTCFGDASGI